ncbi:flagellin [bacterium]|nr:flagellin [bacterium]
MSMVINTNTASLIAQQAQAKTSTAMDTAMERLSTGKKINSASDDAAGMAMVMRMESQIKGLSMAMKNAGDAQSLVNTSEGAMDEISNILQRMRELAVQSASDTNVASDRSNLNTEITHLAAEIDRIASQTTWNGTKLLDGTYSAKQFQIGPEAGQIVSVSIDNLASSSLGAHTAESMGFLTGASADDVSSSHSSGVTYTVTGPTGTDTVTVADNKSSKDLAALFNAKTAETGVSASAKTVAKLHGFTLAGDSSATVSFDLNDVAISATNVTATDLRTLMTAINDKASQTGVTAKMGSASNADLILTDLDGDDITIDQFNTSDSTSDGAGQTSHIEVTVLQSDESTSADGTIDIFDIGNSASVNHDVAITGTVELSAVGTFSVTGGSSGSDAFDGTSPTAVTSSAISTVSVTTSTSASAAIKTIDGALSKLAEVRADLGAVSNRLNYTVNNLSSVKVNMEASQSRIEDADFAVETSNLTKAQILSQAATAMLAQANASKQSVLSLLQG